MAESIDIVVNAQDNFSDVLGNFGNIMTGIKSTIDLVTDAFNFAKDAIDPFIESAMDSQVVLAQFDATLRSTGTQQFREDLLQLSTAMMNATGFSDELETQAIGMLLRFENVSQQVFPDVLKLTNDYARALGIDLVSAAQTVGKALDDPASGIGRLNMQFKLFNETEMDNIKTMAEHGDVAGAQALIMERLAEKVGGAADAYAHTFAGSLDIAKEKLDNVRELIGGPIIYLLGEMLDKVVSFAETDPLIQSVLGFFTDFNEILSNDNVPFLSALGVALLHLRDTAPFLHDVGGVLIALQNNLTQGMDPFTAIALGVDTLAEKWGGTPIEGILNRIAEFFDTAKTEGLGTAFGDLISDAFSSLAAFTDSPEFQATIQGFLDKIAQLLGQSDTSSLGDALGDIIGNALLATFNGLDTIIRKVDWGPVGAALGDATSQILDGMLAGFNQSGADAGAPFRAWLSGLWNTSFDTDRFVGLGSDIWQGIVQGLNTFSFNSAEWIRIHLTDPVKNFLGISSPSTFFASIGRDIVLGLINGIDAMADLAKSMISSILATILSPFRAILDFLGIDTSAIFGTSSGIGGGTTGGRSPGTTDTRSGILSGSNIVYNFYGPVYVRTEADMEMFCPSPHPLIAASANSLQTSGIG